MLSRWYFLQAETKSSFTVDDYMSLATISSLPSTFHARTAMARKRNEGQGGIPSRARGAVPFTSSGNIGPQHCLPQQNRQATGGV